METLEIVEDRASALEREQYWIQHFEMLKEPLANINKTFSPRKVKRTGLQAGRSVKHKVERVVFQEPEKVISPLPELVPQSVHVPLDATFPFDMKKFRHAQKRLLAKETQNKIICEVWDVQENTRAFRAAKEEFQLMLAYLASMVGEE